MKYQTMRRIKVGERRLGRTPMVTNQYAWIVTASDLTREEAEAHRIAIKGLRIRPMMESGTQ